jgi:hypothetical protein
MRFQTPSELINTLQIMLDDYKSDFNDSPSAIALGSDEYFLLATYLSGLSKSSDFPTHFHTIPILIKEFSGIELLDSPKNVARHLPFFLHDEE